MKNAKKRKGKEDKGQFSWKEIFSIWSCRNKSIIRGSMSFHEKLAKSPIKVQRKAQSDPKFKESLQGWNAYVLSSELNKPMPWNIYKYTKKKDELFVDHLKEFHVTNFWLKKRVVYFPLMIYYKLFKKHIDNVEIPDTWFNKNLIIFDKAFEQSAHEWSTYYLPATGRHLNPWNIKAEEGPDVSEANEGVKWKYRLIKKSFLRLAAGDTATREFFNIMMFNIYKEMQKEYGGQQINHLFFTSHTPIDVHYMAVGQLLAEGKTKYVPIEIWTKKLDEEKAEIMKKNKRKSKR